MTDLSAALKEAGHDDLAAALERRSLAGQLRQARFQSDALTYERIPPPEDDE